MAFASQPELNLLKVFWSLGKLTLAEVFDKYHSGEFGPAVGFPTMQSRLNAMVKKGLLKCSKKRRPATYQAKVKPEDVGDSHMALLLSARPTIPVSPLFGRILDSCSHEELEELEELMKDRSKKNRK